MQRRYNIDLLRILCTLAVLSLHVVTAPVTNAGSEIPLATKNTLHLIHMLVLWSVPGFFMITGYCLLCKDECTYRYCFSHVLKYILVLFTVGFFYALLEEVFTTRTFSLQAIGSALYNVICGNLWDHMWFVYSIIGVYLVMPLVHGFIISGKQNACIITALLFLLTILLPAIENQLPVRISFPLEGSLFFVFFGGLLSRYKLPRPFMFISVMAALGSIIYIFCNPTLSLGYKSLPSALIAVTVFQLFVRLNLTKPSILPFLAKHTWGIYLFHPLFINVFLKVFKLDLLHGLIFLKLSLFAFLILVLSFALTYLLKRVPYLKKLF